MMDMDLPMDAWMLIFNLLPANTAGARDHLHLTLCFPNARSASLASSLIFKAKFLPNSLNRLQSGLTAFRAKILVQSLLFVSLIPVVLDQAGTGVKAPLKGRNRAYIAYEKWNMIKQKPLRLEKHIQEWIRREIPLPKTTLEVDAVHNYLHMLHNMRPVAALAGDAHRVEVDVRDSKWRKQIYKDVMDRDVDILVWRHRHSIRGQLLDNIYKSASCLSPRMHHVWAWWELFPRQTRRLAEADQEDSRKGKKDHGL
ncbi:hypothetical protein N0V82_010626 [Gnomoniopsis sp. IMI 355080]|nr:hypothetical protein N0V82_010626 [Gnomoniopsis sp. IMI 355080]